MPRKCLIRAVAIGDDGLGISVCQCMTLCTFIASTQPCCRSVLIPIIASLQTSWNHHCQRQHPAAQRHAWGGSAASRLLAAASVVGSGDMCGLTTEATYTPIGRPELPTRRSNHWRRPLYTIRVSCMHKVASDGLVRFCLSHAAIQSLHLRLVRRASCIKTVPLHD